MEGLIFNIQKFCVNDGPGIRTTVFVKGCPIRCLWCHNPESQSGKKELSFDAAKCVLCRACEAVCENGCHLFGESHKLLRDTCTACGKCAELACGCLEIVGKELSVEEIMKIVLRDKTFYAESGGGLTVSGGEPMLDYDFTFRLLKAAKEQGIHVCMETCGVAPTEKYLEIKDHVDIFLYDYKETDPELHKKYTGVSNDLILKNLGALNGAGAKMILRCPIIPGYNDRADHFEGIAKTANAFSNILEVNIEPYHPLGVSKNEKIGRESEIKDLSFPNDETVSEWIDTIQKMTEKKVCKS